MSRDAETACKTRATIAPVLRVSRVYSDRPEMTKRHPGPAGTHQAAATIYASLFRESPIGSTNFAGF